MNLKLNVDKTVNKAFSKLGCHLKKFYPHYIVILLMRFNASATITYYSGQIFFHGCFSLADLYLQLNLYLIKILHSRG